MSTSHNTRSPSQKRATTSSGRPSRSPSRYNDTASEEDGTSTPAATRGGRPSLAPQAPPRRGRATGQGGSGSGSGSGSGRGQEKDKGKGKGSAKKRANSNGGGDGGHSGPRLSSRGGGQHSSKKRRGLSQECVVSGVTEFVGQEMEEGDIVDRASGAEWLANLVEAGHLSLVDPTAAALLQKAGVSVTTPMNAEFVEAVRQAAKEGAAEGVKESLSSSSSSVANLKKTTSGGFRRSAATVTDFIAPYTDALGSPRTVANCGNAPLLEAGYQLYKAEYPDDGSSKQEFATAVLRNTTSDRSETAKAARRTIFESLFAALDLFANHLPAFSRLQDRLSDWSHQQVVAQSLYQIVCRSKLPEDEREAASSEGAGSGSEGAGSGSEGAGSGNDGESGSDKQTEEEHEFLLMDMKEEFPIFWTQSQLGTEGPSAEHQARGIYAPGKRANGMFSYVLSRHSTLIAVSAESGEPEREPYEAHEVLGLSREDMNTTVNAVSQATIASMLASLEDQLNAYNATHPAEEDASSQSTAGSSQSAPVAVAVRTTQAPGFDLIGRARAWLHEREDPADGGGGKKKQEFNVVLFKNLHNVYQKNLAKCKHKSCGNIDDANRILRPYLLKKKKNKRTNAPRNSGRSHAGGASAAATRADG